MIRQSISTEILNLKKTMKATDAYMAASKNYIAILDKYIASVACRSAKERVELGLLNYRDLKKERDHIKNANIEIGKFKLDLAAKIKKKLDTVAIFPLP